MHRSKKEIEQDPRAMAAIKEAGSTRTARDLAQELHTTDMIVRAIAKDNNVKLKPGTKGPKQAASKGLASTPANRFLTMRLR